MVITYNVHGYVETIFHPAVFRREFGFPPLALEIHCCDDFVSLAHYLQTDEASMCSVMFGPIFDILKRPKYTVTVY